MPINSKCELMGIVLFTFNVWYKQNSPTGWRVGQVTIGGELVAQPELNAHMSNRVLPFNFSLSIRR